MGGIAHAVRRILHEERSLRGCPARGIALQVIGKSAGGGGELDREAVTGGVEPRRTAARVASQIRAVGSHTAAGETRRQRVPRAAERDWQAGDPCHGTCPACRRSRGDKPVRAIGDAFLRVSGVVGRARRRHCADIGHSRQTAAVSHLGHGDVVRIVDKDGVSAVAQRRPSRRLVEASRIERGKNHAPVVERIGILGRQQRIFVRAVVDDDHRARGDVVPDGIVLKEEVVAARVLDVIESQTRILQDKQLDPLAAVRPLAELVDDDRTGERGAHGRHVDRGLEGVGRSEDPRRDRPVADADRSSEKRLSRRVTVAGPHRAAPELPGIGLGGGEC